MSLAFDLFWRNDVPARKLNMGLGFYGRAFQLADPACNKPGCVFKGGATKGACSGESGILSYREIMEVIRTKKLNPVHDKEAGVKYITWNTDQVKLFYFVNLGVNALTLSRSNILIT